MQTKEQYDDHLLKFYSDTFRDFALKNGLSSGRYQTNEAEVFANNALRQYGSAINNGVALELLSNLKQKNTTVDDCIDNYPTMFWQTTEGPAELKELAMRDVRSKVDVLIQKIMSKTPLEQNEMENSLRSIVQSAKKVAFKEMHTSGIMLKEFTDNLPHIVAQLTHEPVSPQHVEAYKEKLYADLKTINVGILNVFIEEMDKKNKVDSFSYIHQFMHEKITTLSKNYSIKPKVKHGRI